jgi:ketosteroid isomerase-like protein
MSPTRLSKLESALRTVLEFNKAFNQHDLPGMLELLSPDCIFESASPSPSGALYTGKEAVAQYLQDFFQNSPQAHIETEDAFGLGYHCIARWKLTWTDAAGDEHHLRGADIYRVENGLICERFSYIKGA